MPNFTEGDYVLVAKEERHAGQKLALRWRGPRRVIRAANDCTYEVEDLQTGETDDVHVSRLKFYSDRSLDTTAIMSHVLSSETGMIVARLMRLEEVVDKMYVVVRCKRLPNSKDSREPVEQVYEDVPDMLHRLLKRKNTPQDLTEKVRIVLGF